MHAVPTHLLFEWADLVFSVLRLDKYTVKLKLQVFMCLLYLLPMDKLSWLLNVDHNWMTLYNRLIGMEKFHHSKIGFSGICMCWWFYLPSLVVINYNTSPGKISKRFGFPQFVCYSEIFSSNLGCSVCSTGVNVLGLCMHDLFSCFWALQALNFKGCISSCLLLIL